MSDDDIGDPAALQQDIERRARRRHKRQKARFSADNDVVCDGFEANDPDCTLPAEFVVTATDDADRGFERSFCERCTVAASFALDIDVAWERL